MRRSRAFAATPLLTDKFYGFFAREVFDVHSDDVHAVKSFFYFFLKGFLLVGVVFSP